MHFFEYTLCENTWDILPLFKGRGANFNCLSRWGRLWKIKKGDGSIVQGQFFLKKGEGAGTFLCNFLKVYHFYISDAFYFYFWILVK